MVAMMLNSNWTTQMTNLLPTYGLMIVSATVMSFLAIKLFLFAKAATRQKKPREWVFTDERDENGMPVLAPARVRSSHSRMH